MGRVGASEFVFGGPFDKPNDLADTSDIEINVAARSASDECDASVLNTWNVVESFRDYVATAGTIHSGNSERDRLEITWLFLDVGRRGFLRFAGKEALTP